MKKHLIIAASLLTLFAASCSNEDIIENENSGEVAGKAISLNATINNGPDTRLEYTDEDGKAMSVAWSGEESFMMYRGTNSTGTTFTNSSEKPSSFTGETPAGEEGSYYAVYGNNITNNGNGTLTLDLSQPQIGDASAKDGITEMMLATTDVLDESTSLSFNHLLTVLKLNLEFPENVSGKIDKVTVMGLHNKATYTLADESYAYEDDNIGNVTATNGDAGFTIADHKITAYVAVFPEEVAAFQMVIHANVGENEYMYTLKSANTLTAGKVIPVNVSMNYNYGGYECVDLGLSVKWATCNVGAKKPSEYGGYYAWGETKTKSDYSLSTYMGMSSISDCGTDKDPLKDYVYSNNKSIAGTDYDVAHVKWGGTWKMPTQAQIEELYNTSNCSRTWTENYNGTNIAGWILISLKDGYTSKSIFLPAAGYRNGPLLDYEGFDGYYWSATPYSKRAYGAYSLYFDSDDIDWYYHYFRYYGQSVRPVSE